MNLSLSIVIEVVGGRSLLREVELFIFLVEMERSQKNTVYIKRHYTCKRLTIVLAMSHLGYHLAFSLSYHTFHCFQVYSPSITVLLCFLVNRVLGCGWFSSLRSFCFYWFPSISCQQLIAFGTFFFHIISCCNSFLYIYPISIVTCLSIAPCWRVI